MYRWAALGLAFVCGCFNPQYSSGHLKCEGTKCPRDFHCAVDGTCWKNGSDPDLSMTLPDDLGEADSSTSSDLGSADLTPPVKHQGEACGGGDTCDTGQCVDGYCCNSVCSNTCQACNLAGSLGVCSNVAIGMDPVGSRGCNPQAASTCGRDGKCDGDGNCRNWPSGTECVVGTCDVGTGNFVYPSTCNGTGACVANGSGNCAPYDCKNAAECHSSCTTGDNTPCSGSNMCVNNSCGLLPDGRLCGTNGAQCMSGNCVDGYCCNTGCTNACQACDVPGNFGVCTTVAAGAPHGATRMCTNFGIAPCGGRCNGSLGTCFYPDNTVPCGSTCSSATQLQNSFCNSNGGCSAAAPSTCSGNLKCIGSACLTMCSGNDDCAAGHGCSSNMCKFICVFDTSMFDDGCIYGP